MKKYIVFLVALLMVGFWSCEEPAKKTADDFVVEGWEFMDAGDEVSASESFFTAIDKDNTCANAYVGLGWIDANNSRYSDAIDVLIIATALDANHLDANASLSVLYQAIDSLSQCIDTGSIVVGINPSYSFEHNSDINSSLLYGLMASAYYGLGDYANAAAQMDFAAPANAPHNAADLGALLMSIMDFLGLS